MNQHVKRNSITLITTFALLFFVPCIHADSSLSLLVAKQAKGMTEYSINIKIIAVMAVLSVLPALLVTLTAFTRIIIVLAILRQGLGIPNVPNNQVLIGLALIMTFFVMAPIAERMNTDAVTPYMDNKMSLEDALTSASKDLKVFLLKQTRQSDLTIFQKLAHIKHANNTEYPLTVIMPSYITSELKTAFEIGFLVLLPFLIIDLVVASVLMSMGMMLLSPMIISLPFKLLFFVLVDGWSLVVMSLITSFRM